MIRGFHWRAWRGAAGLALIASLGSVTPALAAQGVAVAASSTAIGLFVFFVVLTVLISVVAVRRTRSLDDFLAASGRVRPLPNGLALAGDFMSAGAFLGLSGLVYTSGFDGIVYAIGYIASWPVVMFLIAEPLRNLGRFTMADALAYRLDARKVHTMAAVNSLVIIVFYLIAQMVGGGQLIQLLFGIDYAYAIWLVGTLMIVCVMLGGMVGTTWVQITKAVILLFAGALIAGLTLATFDFNFGALLRAAVAVHPDGAAILSSQILPKDPVSGISLGLALIFGTAGLPHILMRFFTVRDGRAAATSVAWATLFIGSFFLLLYPIGFGAVALLTKAPEYHLASGALIGGANMVAIHLAHAVGGDVLMAFVSAVAFATIIAVVSGLTMAGASAISHDLLGFTGDAQHGDVGATGIWVSRVATVCIGAAAIGLGLAFQKQNIVYMIGLVFAIAASANFPVLVLSLYWPKLTTAGALAGGLFGLCVSVVMTVLGPAVWVKVLGHPSPVINLDPPTIVTMPLTFLVCWLISVCDESRSGAEERALFAGQVARAMGVGTPDGG